MNPETQRRKSAKAWEAKSEVAKVRHSLDLTQVDFAKLLGIGLSALRSWEQKKTRTLRHGENAHPHRPQTS